MNFVMASLWMNDADRQIQARMERLTSHVAPGPLRFAWGVGDSQDGTPDILREYADAHPGLDIEIVDVTTGMASTNPAERVARKSKATSKLLDTVRATDDVWIHHESDLTSPYFLPEAMVNLGDVGAGMVWLQHPNGRKAFYDTWAYRKGGRQFEMAYPYHPCYTPGAPFEVDSVGSCFSMPASAIRDGLRCEKMDVLELTTKLRQDYGYRIMVDPDVDIYQPYDLWVAYAHA